MLRDINDNDPVFLDAPYSVDIMENQTDVVMVYKVNTVSLAKKLKWNQYHSKVLLDDFH